MTSSTSSIMPSASSKQQQQQQQRGGRPLAVQFGSVEIRDMPMVLGQHPPTGGGAPLTLDWEPTQIRELPVDLYEVYKEDGREPVRRESDLQMTQWDRAQILLRAGYSLDDIAVASEEAQLVLKQRESSLAAQKVEFWHLARESAQRKVSRAAMSLGGRAGRRGGDAVPSPAAKAVAGARAA
jgi:hypothetical protein